MRSCLFGFARQASFQRLNKLMHMVGVDQAMVHKNCDWQHQALMLFEKLANRDFWHAILAVILPGMSQAGEADPGDSREMDHIFPRTFIIKAKTTTILDFIHGDIGTSGEEAKSPS